METRLPASHALTTGLIAEAEFRVRPEQKGLAEDYDSTAERRRAALNSGTHMRIRAGYDLVYDHPQPTPMMLLLSISPERVRDLETDHRIAFEPHIPSQTHTDAFGNICTRIVAPAGPIRITSDFVVRDSGLPDMVRKEAVQMPVEKLPSDVLMYLFGSRYCDTDKLMDVAWATFGGTRPGWERVQAICDYVHNRIAFNYQNADSTRSAYGGHCDQTGVCRDFAHLAITFCRCMNIPARYCTGYLGDIGVPPDAAPMDFSAWFEVYLDGRWYTFDARHNHPRIGRVVMARGRDATDVAFSTAFGPSLLRQFRVITEEVGEEVLLQSAPPVYSPATVRRVA
jgi:transglutaminase-like putative cysteine protease